MSFNKKVAQEMQEQINKGKMKIVESSQVSDIPVTDCNEEPADVYDKFVNIGYNTAILDMIQWGYDKMLKDNNIYIETTITIRDLLEKLESLMRR